MVEAELIDPVLEVGLRKRDAMIAKKRKAAKQENIDYEAALRDRRVTKGYRKAVSICFNQTEVSKSLDKEAASVSIKSTMQVQNAMVRNKNMSSQHK